MNALSEKPDDYPADKEWVQIIEREIEDPWANPYQYVRSDELEHGSGIYSYGPDGVSISQGNDMDDWNSWDPTKRSTMLEQSRDRLSFYKSWG